MNFIDKKYFPAVIYDNFLRGVKINSERKLIEMVLIDTARIMGTVIFINCFSFRYAACLFFYNHC